MRSMVLGGLLGCALGLVAGTAPARAQSASPPVGARAPENTLRLTALRERLARLSSRPAAGAEGALRPAAGSGTAQGKVSPSALVSIEHLIDVAERIRSKFPSQAVEWQARATAHLDAAERGEDLYPDQRGQIVSRGYRSPISQRVQGYTVYVPPDYTPDKSWPLMIVLHGGSSNGNLFLGVVLGNNMDWKTYDAHLWDKYEPRWSPNFIVAAPDGYGQVLWRWMGEQDVLDVIDDIAKNYKVDADRVVLSGLSNGGVGAYAIGTRHADRFSVVQAMAGAPSWIQYAGAGSVSAVEAALMRPWSAMDLAENWYDTDFRYYHGNVDPGPMKPAYVHALDQSVETKKIPHTGKWFEAGHDLLYIVHRHGKVFPELENVRRNPHPREVHLVSGDYRAARQHWLELTRFERYPELARLVAKLSTELIKGSSRTRVDGVPHDRIDITTENALAFALHLQDVPLSTADLVLAVNGERIYDGPRGALGARVELVKRAGWELGTPKDTGLAKRAGLSGPLTDAYYGRMVHVYGTQRPENTAALKLLAEKGARGYPLWLWTVEQEVLPDTALTPAISKDAHVVLYGTPGDNAVLDRIASKLPIQIDASAVKLGSASYAQKGVGTRFVYPNPEAPDHYVVVFSAPTLDGVKRGLNLPDFVPDYVVYDAASTGARPRLVPGKGKPVRGFFDASWQLPHAQKP